MKLKSILDYEGLYSLDLDNNQVYSHRSKKYLKITTRRDGYNIVSLLNNKKYKIIYLHRLVYEIHNGYIPTTMFIDHIDLKKNNNNNNNLRLATNSQNQMNRRVGSNNKLGIKNIKLTNCKTYQVTIANNKQVYNKNFKTLEEAIENRNIQLKKYHGQYANLD